MASKTDSGKTYHLQCTGEALETANTHSGPADITLFGSCFCPFVQRVWVAFEYLGIDYKYYEVDPYKKPTELLEVSAKGLVPGLKLNNYNPPKSVNESTVILEFLEDRALIRLQADHVSRILVPAFYRYIQAQEEDKQIEGAKEFVEALSGLTNLFERAERESTSDLGLWKEEGKLSFADVMAGPWILRATNVLPYYRSFTLPEGPRFRAYVDRLLNHSAFKKTCSTDQLYLDSYERYAHNRPNTSQVANAINSGRGLP